MADELRDKLDEMFEGNLKDMRKAVTSSADRINDYIDESPIEDKLYALLGAIDIAILHHLKVNEGKSQLEARRLIAAMITEWAEANETFIVKAKNEDR